MDAKLNSSQQAVVDSDAKKLLCLAGAGSGKTYTLIHRIIRLVEDGVSPTSILVLTFTNAAAFEMKHRYEKYSRCKSSPKFGTFHAFCYFLLADSKKVREALGYDKVPQIVDEDELEKISRECRLKCKTTLSATMLAKDIKEITPRDRWQYEVYHKAFKKAIREANVITFDLLSERVSQLFISNDECIQTYKRQYKYIMVDEMQDTDPTQWGFVTSFTDAEIMVVGDAKQAIYGFRGGTSDIIKSLAASDEWTTIKLFQNYRSTDEICQYANTIHSFWKDEPYNLDIRSDKISDEPSVIFEPGLEAEDIGPLIAINMHTTMQGYNSAAVLARTNDEVYRISKAFKDAEIDFRTKSAVEPVTCILKAVLDSEYAINWLCTFLPSNKYNDYLRLCMTDSSYRDEEVFYKKYLYIKQIRVYGKYIKAIREVLNSKDLTLIEKYEYIERNLKLSHRPDVELTDEENLINTLIERTSETLDKTKIYIGTIHSVKGLEFDVVHVIGVDGNHFSITSEESKNVYYVACTRARERLYIHSSLVAHKED